jgi:hypothetical protein
MDGSSDNRCYAAMKKRPTKINKTERQRKKQRKEVDKTRKKHETNRKTKKGKKEIRRE